MSKFIITGTGRCGTTYCKAILQICGINTGHQQVFNWDSVKTGEWDWTSDYGITDNLDGDSSFMAVPLLEKVKEKEPDTTIITINRPLVNVLNSWQMRGVFVDGWETFYPEWAEQLDILTPDGVERSIEWLERWNEKANLFSDYVLSIDNLTRNPHLLFQAIGKMDKYDASLVKLISTRANSND